MSALKEKTAEIHAQLPVDLASYIINEKRAMVQQIELRHQIKVVIIPNPYLIAPDYQIQRFKSEQLNKQKKASFELLTPPTFTAPSAPSDGFVEKPAVDFQTSEGTKLDELNFLQRIIQKWFTSSIQEKDVHSTSRIDKAHQASTESLPAKDKKNQHGSQNRRRRQPNQGQRQRRGQNHLRHKQHPLPNEDV